MTRTAPVPSSATTGRRVLSEDDGVLPPGTSVFDDHLPGVANVHRDLLRAVRRAAVDAAAEGVDLQVNSGWRSPAYQSQLLQDAVLKFGSRAEAARWVATPERSAHVSGDAIDIGPPRAAAWLSTNGARYGLCRIYQNEPWHFELRLDAIENGSPSMYPDPTYDPRLNA
ncbi:M15 family metallopeptidase [Williamsia sp. R60]